MASSPYAKSANHDYFLLSLFYLQVCGKCVLKESCSFVNQGVWGGDTKHLNLADVMTIIVLYALELVPPQMGITDEIKASVSHLLDEIVKLSCTVS